MTEPTILLIEDNGNDVVLIKRALAKAKVANPLALVPDGDEAVAYLAGAAAGADGTVPGLILLDLKLPRRSGLEVLQWLRQQPRLQKIPVVALTSSREPGDINRAYELGVNSYLVKPANPDDLLTMVKALAQYWLQLNQPAGA